MNILEEIQNCPVEWKELGEVCKIETGKLNANESVEDGKYPFFTTAKEISRINEYAYDGEVVLVAGNGDLNVKYYKGKFNAYQRTYVLIPDLEYYALLYLASMYQTKSFKSAASGSIVKFITKGDIENIPVFIPDNKAILNKFNCLLMLQEQYQKESDELASIRDWLLPMLMNGQAAIED